MGTEPTSNIRADFDRIALVSSGGWDHNGHYHSFLLRHVPAHCEAALDIGCGTGTFSRLLAERARRVIALDLSPRMIEVARERSRRHPNIEYQVADARTWEFPDGRFDCVASIAAMHHLPLEEMLLQIKGALRVGGVLVILDLCESVGLGDFLIDAVAVPVSIALRLVKSGRLRTPREVREAWAEHGQRDVYSSLATVRQVCSRALPGAEVRRHLLWRYSIVWRKGVRDAHTGDIR